MSGVGIVLGQSPGPRSVQQITKAAESYEYDAEIPLKYWLRTASTLLREAEIYGREGDDETTYFLLYRHAHLVLAQLPQHSQAKDQQTKIQLKDAEREVKKNLQVLDVLRPKINERHDRYTKILEERAKRRNEQVKRASFESEGPHRPIQQHDVRRLQAHENKDLAIEIAQRESSRRAAIRDQSSRQSTGEADDLSKRLQAIRIRVEPQSRPADTRENERRSLNDKNSGYQYPSIPSRNQAQSQSRPAQTQYPGQRPIVTSPPTVPLKLNNTGVNVPARPEKIIEQPAKAGKQTGPEASYMFAASAHLESGAPLRPLFLPPTLRTTFLRHAHKNTLANLETCGFLAGSLTSNAFFVSKLIIPAQTSTSDTCEMTNESDLFDYVDSEDLMILGWIHTHPTQTCFMSSRDLHTHAGYQMMLAESVAIVCAPSKGDTTHGGDWGAYRLTDPPGKKVILNCENPGIFHPHSVDNLYTDALKPGHVVEVKGLEFEVVDMR